MIPNFRRSSRSLGDLGMDATAEPMCCRGSGTARGPAGLGTVPHCRIARHCDSKGGIRNCTERKVNERRARVPEALKTAFSKPRSIVTGARCIPNSAPHRKAISSQKGPCRRSIDTAT